ncbi:MAG: M67 family peptidase [Candidatus Omnitrophica bacterium]|nr:M67 family peptidase [Candidatus Omnitrophota bacterium]
MPLTIPQNLLFRIQQHAEQEYPQECCGLGLATNKNPDTLLEIIPCRNVQDELHRKDPQTYPRTSRAAYLIDPRELLLVHQRLRRDSLIICLIYHSHIDAPAAFSEEDRRQALWEGNPVYPNAAYLIFSIQAGKAFDSALFIWDSSRQDFIRG